MHLRLPAAFLAAAIAIIAAPLPTLADGIDKLTDKPLNQYVNFAGMRTRIDKIETVANGDGRPILQKAGGTNDGTGYIVVTVSMQNPSDSKSITIPGANFGFELADGTQIDEAGASGYFILPSLNEPPDALHPKQHVTLAYVITNWNGQPITKMFVKNNSGTDDNNTGYRYLRFQIPKDYVQVLSPVPTPQPTGE